MCSPLPPIRPYHNAVNARSPRSPLRLPRPRSASSGDVNLVSHPADTQKSRSLLAREESHRGKKHKNMLLFKKRNPSRPRRARGGRPRRSPPRRTASSPPLPPPSSPPRWPPRPLSEPRGGGRPRSAAAGGGGRAPWVLHRQRVSTRSEIGGTKIYIDLQISMPWPRGQEAK